MDIKPIHTPADHAAALKEVERLWDNAQPGTSDGDKFEVLTALVDAYEREHFEIPRAHSAARRGRRRAGSRVLRSRRGKAIVGWALSTSSSRLAQSSRTIAGHFGFPHRRSCSRAAASLPSRRSSCAWPLASMHCSLVTSANADAERSIAAASDAVRALEARRRRRPRVIGTLS